MKYFSHMPFKGTSEVNNNKKMSDVLSVINAKKKNI